MANVKVTKTEHSGAKDSSHDKWTRRALLKQASKKRRRVNDRMTARTEGVEG